MDEPPASADEQHLASGQIGSRVAAMAILFTFLLGIGNFALHKAVIESRHPVVGLMPRFLVGAGGRGALIAEFAILLAVLLLIANGQYGWGWGYLAYSASNAAALSPQTSLAASSIRLSSSFWPASVDRSRSL